VGKIAYLLKVFPRVSETFVINEIRAVEDTGEEVAVFSLHHNPDGPVTHGILGELKAEAVYVEDRDAGLPEKKHARRRLEQELAVLWPLPPQPLRERLLPRKYVRLATRLAQLVVENDIDCLHAHFASRAGHVVALASRLAGVPYSITAHAKDIYHDEVDQEVLRWKIAGASFVVTVTDFNLRHLRELVADIPGAPEKIVRLYNGVDLERFEACEPADLPRPRLVSVGRLVEKKGFHHLVEACRALVDRGYDFDCVIVGGGEKEESLKAKVASLGLEDTVHFAGSVTTEEVGDYLRESTATVLPCIVGGDGNVDALPTVLLEAMATARPLVSTALSGIPEIIDDGENGYLVEPGDVAGLTDAIARLLDDPARAAAMGVAGRKKAEELFSLRVNAGRLRDMLRQGQTGEPVA